MIKKILPYLVLTLIIITGVKLVNASEVTGNLNPGLDTGISGVTKAAPTLSPAAGDFHSTQTVSLTAAGATKICYTTNGNEPSCATATTCTTGTALASGGTISISSASTIKSAGCYSDLSSGPVATSAYTFTCPPASNAVTYNSYPTCGPATCNSGYTLSGGSCIAQSSGGGGGGGATITYCSSVTYGDWATACFSGLQFRNALTQTPSGCSLTSTQQLAAQRACQVTATSTPPITETPPVVDNTGTPLTFDSGAIVLQNIATESGIMGSNNQENLLAHLGATANSAQEQAGLIKYKTILGLDKNISAADKTMLNNFIVYGTLSTHRLGAGERAAVLNSYYQAYHRLPNSEAEWSDILKIASGRWPVERSVTAENQAKVEFKKVYLRNAVMTNNIDENAIMVIAYGLLPLQRNLNSEKVAIKTFRYVYGHDPINALAWNVVRAIAYSGAKR